MDGWIKLHRKLLDWRWFSDGNMLKVFLYILLKSNHKKKSWKGIDILPGQMIFSRRKVSERLEISETQLRTVIARLKSTHEITHESTNQFTLITVVNWASYQNEDYESTHESTHDFANEQPTDNQRITTPKERKERLEGKEKKIPAQMNFSPFPDSFAENWKLWKDYKANEHKDSYKTVMAEQIAFNKLVKISNGDPKIADSIILQCIENHWKGLYASDGFKKNNPTPPKSTSIGRILNAD